MDSWHVWIIIGVALVAAEMLTGEFFFLSLGVAALATGGIASAFELSFNAELGVFAGAAALTLLVLRPFLKSFVFRNSDDRKTNVNALVGQVVLVTEPVEDDEVPGRSRVGGEGWRTVSEVGARFEKGMRGEIVAVSGATLTIRQTSN